MYMYIYLSGGMGSLNSEIGSMKIEVGNESSFAKLQPSSPPEESSESKKKKTPLMSNNSLTPSSLTLPPLVLDGDIEIPSPDSSLWESFFSDGGGDFMISSPAGKASMSSSPPPPLGPYYSGQKGKGMSPLHRLLNSPNNNNNELFMPVETLSLPALENFLDDYEGDDHFLSSECYDTLTTVPELLDCLTHPNSYRFCGPVSDTAVQGGSEMTHQTEIYDQMTAPKKQIQRLRQPPPPPPQQHQVHNTTHNSVVPISVGPDQEQDSGLQLVHLLLACAEAVAIEDYMSARRHLHHLNRVVSPLGDSMQRVASCFTEALSARLAATLTTKPTTTTKPFTPFPQNSLEILKIYQILYQACPYIKFAHFTANQAIFEAFESEERVHVIDLDILQGYQWPDFMQALAARPCGPPFLRITGVGSSAEAVRETGRCLTELAHSLRIPFEFHPIGEELEDIKPHMFNRRVGEALAVNSVNRLQRVPGHFLGNLLAMIRDQAPNIVTIVEQEASHNGPYFLGRFLEALHYYSAIFDSLDATFPVDSAQRAKVEQYIFLPEIRNIVACEGPERVMRHERLEKWRKVVEGKGFRGVALSSNAVTQSKILLGLYSCDGYRLTEDNGCLVLGWQDRPLITASAWRC